MNGLIKRGKTWTIRYTTPEGKRKWEAIGSSKRQAELVLAKRKVEIAEDRYFSTPKGRKWTYGTLLDRYLEYAKVAKRASTYETDTYWAKHLREAFGGILLKDVTVAKVTTYLEGKLASGYAPATVGHHLALLKHSFTMAVRWALLPVNPILGVHPPVKINNERVRYLNADEIDRLLEHCTPLWRNAALIALYTGMRKSEIFTLRWEQIDFSGCFARLPDSKNGEGRLVPLDPVALDTYRTIQGEQVQLGLNSSFVFMNPKTKKPYRADSHKTWDRILVKAGFTDLHFNDLRHTMASHLRMAGIDLLTIGEILGHRDLRMTKRYAHVAPSYKLKAVGVLALSYGQSENGRRAQVEVNVASKWQQNRQQALETPLL